MARLAKHKSQAVQSRRPVACIWHANEKVGAHEFQPSIP